MGETMMNWMGKWEAVGEEIVKNEWEVCEKKWKKEV